MELDLTLYQQITAYQNHAKCTIKYHDQDHPHWLCDEEETSCYVSDTSDEVHSFTTTDVEHADDELSEGSFAGSVSSEVLLTQQLSGFELDSNDEDFSGKTGKSKIRAKGHLEDKAYVSDENNNHTDKDMDVKYLERSRSLSESEESIKAAFEQWVLVDLTETRSSKTRWFVLFVICASIFVRSFVSVVFGQVNDVFSAYYNVPPGAVDWLTTTGFLATLFVAPLVVKLGRGKTNLRRLCCLMTGSASVGTMLLTTAVVSREHGFALAIAGQAVMGANNAVAMTIPPLVAAVWFPEHETATSLALSLVSVGVGDALGSYIPAELIVTPEFEENANYGLIQFKLVTMFACTAGASILTFIIATGFVDERPVFPPSKAQLSKTGAGDSSTESQMCDNVSLLHDKDFIMVALFYGVSAASGANSITLLSSIIRETFAASGFENLDSVAGKIVSTMFVCFSFGPLVAGRILDKTKSYRSTALVGMAGLAIGTSGVTASLLLTSVEGLYVSHVFVGFFMGVAETALFEIASEVTYPKPEMDFSCVLVMTWMAFFVMYPVIGRRALNSAAHEVITSSVVASLMPAACTLSSFVLAAFLLRPKCKRREAAQSLDAVDPDENNERTPLLEV